MARMRSFKTFCKASEYVGMDTVPHKKKVLKEEVLDESWRGREATPAFRAAQANLQNRGSHKETTKPEKKRPSLHDDMVRGHTIYDHTTGSYHHPSAGSNHHDKHAAVLQKHGFERNHAAAGQYRMTPKEDKVDYSQRSEWKHPDGRRAIVVSGWEHHGTRVKIHPAKLKEETLDERNADNKFKKDLHIVKTAAKRHITDQGIDIHQHAMFRASGEPEEGRKKLLQSLKRQGRRDLRREETLEELAHSETPKTFVTGTAKNRTVQDGLHDRLSKHYNIDDEDKKHLGVFQQYGHDINKGLKDKNKPKEETSKPKKTNPGAEEAAKKETGQLDAHTKALDGALGQHVSPSADFHIYTALKGCPVKSHEEATGVKHDGKSEIRGVFHHFAQASINPAVAREHAEGTTHFGADKTNHVLKLKVPAKSKHGVYVGDHGHSEHREFLMRPGRKFHIGAESETHGDTKIWHGELQG